MANNAEMKGYYYFYHFIGTGIGHLRREGNGK